ncbi:hypothetical protein D3W54_07960 [Komagataeibacter medellinensis]|uniref:Uncharacterized protein n=2 Tax=Komagataeibacter medellinensis TaxID=1177712 RepID=A0ABQ6VWZ3_9PROT|nr:hypothetical protein D3W54_07960 [Komagataeibacter medellinensis]
MKGLCRGFLIPLTAALCPASVSRAGHVAGHGGREKAMSDDRRIGLEFVADPAAVPSRAGTLLVAEAGTVPATMPGWAGVVVVPAASPTAFAAMAHGMGCGCCTPRGSVATVLADAFRSRAIGALPWFDRVAVLPPPGLEAAWRAALAGDVLVCARFALQPGNVG